MRERVYDKGFDAGGFIEWIEDRFSLNPYAVEIVYNIIEYAQEHEHVGKDMFAEFVADLMPSEVTMLDVAKYMEDGCLTKSTLRMLGRIE